MVGSAVVTSVEMRRRARGWQWLWDKARAMREGAATKADVVLVSHGMLLISY